MADRWGGGAVALQGRCGGGAVWGRAARAAHAPSSAQAGLISCSTSAGSKRDRGDRDDNSAFQTGSSRPTGSVPATVASTCSCELALPMPSNEERSNEERDHRPGAQTIASRWEVRGHRDSPNWPPSRKRLAFASQQPSTSLLGGIGTVRGSILGAFFIGALNNGMSLMGVSEFYQKVIKGVIIILAVWFDTRQSRAPRT